MKYTRSVTEKSALKLSNYQISDILSIEMIQYYKCQIYFVIDEISCNDCKELM